MSTELTVRDNEYRPVQRLLNGVVGAADSLGLPLCTVEQDSILRAARRSTRLDDFGDEAFRVPMGKMVEAINRAPFTSLGKAIVRQAFIHAASNCLRFEALLKRRPEILEQRVERPIFVLGFPRTGTTVLQHLLCLDPGRRGLECWEVSNPIPAHDDPEIDYRRRIRATQRVLRLAYLMAPEMGEVHFIGPNTLEECWPLFGSAFAVLNWDLQSGLRDYGSWLTSDYDMVGPYQEYKRYLQLLTWRRPADHLVLKCPEHLWFIDALLEVFPDACIVWTHRDPFDTIASYCSLISMQYRTLYGRIDPKQVGRHITERFLMGIRRAMRARAKHSPDRFFDMPFHDMVSDQRGAIRDITRYFDLPYRPGTDEAIASWLDSRREDARGKHKYSAERYGLDADEIHGRYADYIESFSVKVRAA